MMCLLRLPTLGIAACLILSLSFSPTVRAQLTDITQTNPVIAGGQIGKSLAEQVGAGQGDAFTPGSSIYLIKRDPARAIRRGRQLFQRKFTAEQGLGPRVDTTSSGNITDNRALGAGLVDSCASCHGRPRGAAGFGGAVATRPDSRDAPHLFGLGLIEMLGDEMTSELREQRSWALAQAARDEPCVATPPVCSYTSDPGLLCDWLGWLCPKKSCKEAAPCGEMTIELTAKGVGFGKLTAFADGSLDLSKVEGVNPDLRVRPFFAQGGTVSMREFVVGALSAEMGLQAADPLLCAATDPKTPQRVVSPAGMVFDPTLDAFERPPVCDARVDGDRDGVVNEIDPALIDYLEFYLLSYFKPGRGRTDKLTKRGLALMDEARCTDCHRRNLTVDRDRRVADVETQYDPTRGIFNHLFATATPLFEKVYDGQRYPQLLPAEAEFEVEEVFTDLKRHDLGPEFYEREYDGSLVTELMTRPLWGVGTSSPYGHDGRSINLEEVILRHGGEAAESRDRFAALSDSDRYALLAFLGSLVLFPPDDTACNLNPGKPATGNPQDPAEHGSINLGALFQIPEEGQE